MNYPAQVVWSEGLFLRPQHFQQQGRYTEHYIQQLHSAHHHYGWGIEHLKVSSSSTMLSVTEGSGIFPDGTPFILGETAVSPRSISLNKIKSGDRIFLCIEPKSLDSAKEEFAPQTDSDRIKEYDVDSSQIKDGKSRSTHPADSMRYSIDTILIGNNAKRAAISGDRQDSQYSSSARSASTHMPSSAHTPIEVGMLRTFLMAQDSPPAHAVAIEIAQINEVKHDQLSMNERFIAAHTDVKNSPVLMELLSDLHQVMRSRASQLSKMVGDLTSASAVNLDFLWLVSLNRYSAMLGLFLSASRHPTELYQWLAGCLAELQSYADPSREIEVLSYQHDDLTTCIYHLRNQLTEILGQPLHSPAAELPLKFFDDKKMWVSLIKDRRMLENGAFYISARAHVILDELRQCLPEKMTISAVEKIQERLLGSADLRLHGLSTHPAHLPRFDDWVYFKIEGEFKAWEEFTTSDAFAFHVDGLKTVPGLELRFWTVY